MIKQDYKEFPKNEGQAFANYLIGKFLELRGLTYIKYEMQMVTGFNHRITFQDADKKDIVVVVYEDTKGHLHARIIK